VLVKCILNTGLLPSFLKSTANLPHMSTEVRDKFTHAIFEYVGHHLIFRSVLVSVEKSVNKIDRSGIGAALI
jgi:hypothetical protein